MTEAGSNETRQRLAFWGTLALMRCVASSPAAAVNALSARAVSEAMGAEERDLASVLDRQDEDVEGSDVEPDALARLGVDPKLQALIKQASALAEAPQKDPKLACLKQVVTALRGHGHNPVVFCRYISTARLVGEYLRKAFKDAEVAIVTGELPATERKEAVNDLMGKPGRILVATDCLSEGINLQDGFDAVVHYDLSWNPTKHQQREGRVDRFMQPSKVVRSVMIYGEDNPVDGAVLNVIIEGARRIERELGVIVTLPEDERAVSRALMQAMLLRGGGGARSQMTFDFFAGAEEAMTLQWRDAAERERRTKTIFAQSVLKPQDVVAEWQRANEILGTEAEVLRFARSALNAFGAPLPKEGRHATISLAPLPMPVRERLDVLGFKEEVKIHFEGLQAPSRSHPLVATLAEHIVESALEEGVGARLPRASVWRAREVNEVQTIALVRMRFRVFLRTRSGETMRVAEQVGSFRLVGRDGGALVAEDALALLGSSVAQDVPAPVAERMVAEALARIDSASGKIERYAADLAKTLEADHRRVARSGAGRAAQIDIGLARVEPILPLDIVGLFVVLPALQG